MKTFTVLIREVVTTDRRVTFRSASKIDALRWATHLAAATKRGAKYGRKTAHTVQSFPLPKTLERQD